MRVPTEEELRNLPESEVRDHAIAMATALTSLHARDEMIAGVFGRMARWAGIVAAGQDLHEATRHMGHALHQYATSNPRGDFPARELIEWISSLLNRLIRIGMFRWLAFIVGPMVLLAQLFILYQQNKILSNQLHVDERELAQAAIATSISTRTVLSRAPLDRDGKPITDYESQVHSEVYRRIARWPRPNAATLQQLQAFLRANLQQGVSTLEPLLYDDNVSVASSVFAVLSIPFGTDESFKSIDFLTNARDVNLLRADLSNTNLAGLRWRGGRAAQIRLENAVLSKAQWHGLAAPGAVGDGLHAEDATFVCANFSGGEFSQADFSRASLVGVSFENSCLHHVNLSEAAMFNTRFTSADLRCATVVPRPQPSVVALAARAYEMCKHIRTDFAGANIYLVQAPRYWIDQAFAGGAVCTAPDGKTFTAADCPVRSIGQPDDPCALMELQCP